MKKNSLIVLASIFLFLAFTNIQATLFTNTVDNGYSEQVYYLASSDTSDDDKKDKTASDI